MNAGELEPGMRVTWRYEPRGGYGYTIPVPAFVVAVTARRVGIAAARANGTWVPRWVTAERLELASQDHPNGG